ALPSRELRIAQAMLPAALGEYSRVALVATVVGSGAVPAGDDPLAEAAATFGAREIYRADYARKPNVGEASTPTTEVLRVNVVDSGEPANAFGLWRALEPAGAKRINIGRAGWQDADGRRIAFWAGRHYTELHVLMSMPAEAMDNVVRALAGVQLVTGGPFWAESVLPADGRVEDSLRYVRREPLGLTALRDCWLADYPDGVTLGVMKPPPDRREAMLVSLRDVLVESDSGPAETGYEEAAYSEESSDESVLDPGSQEPSAPRAEARGYDASEQESHEDPSQRSPASQTKPEAKGRVSGTTGGRTVIAAGVGEYVFVAVGPEPAKVAALFELACERQAAAQSVAAAGPAHAAPPPTAGAARFPDLGDAEIFSPTRIERYTDNLYQKINGRESQFRQFGFVELRVGQYQHVPGKQVFDAYVFDMGEAVNAMGIYMTEKSGSAHAIDLGREGYVSGASVYFWKGRYYVYVLGPADGENDGAAKVAERISRAIEATIADDFEPFWAEKLLPAEDRVPDSMSYRATSGLGFDFLKGMFVAEYKTGDKTYQMYVIRSDDTAGARKVFEQFAEATAKYDKILSRGASPGGETMAIESVGRFGAAFFKGRYFGGVTDCEDRNLAERKAAAFRDSLKVD
ncbi:MAG TPA: DUF6599 family protein, partial [Phycisphaerae bacterium]|nr:DUF6599 family protein [Phycisphaerae bacterium]